MHRCGRVPLIRSIRRVTRLLPWRTCVALLHVNLLDWDFFVACKRHTRPDGFRIGYRSALNCSKSRATTWLLLGSAEKTAEPQSGQKVLIYGVTFSEWKEFMRTNVMLILVAMLVLNVLASPVHAQTNTAHVLKEDDFSFRSTGEELHGTVIAPEGGGENPAIVLLGGSGPEKRDNNRKLAEAFARAGIVAFIYDKRTRGHSADPTGARSYSLLADDAAAAAETIRTLDYVDANNIGVDRKSVV